MVQSRLTQRIENQTRRNVLLTCIGIAIYLTYSRSALIALLVSITVFLWLYKQKKLIVVAFFCMLFALFLFPKSFQTEGTNVLRMASSEARLITAGQAFIIFEKNPLYGVGFNAYRFAQHRYGFLSGSKWLDSHGGSSTDNSYLFVLATTGVIGFVAYIYLLYSISRVILQKQTVLRILTFASLVGICASSLFINSLFYVFILEWVCLMVGLTVTESS